MLNEKFKIWKLNVEKIPKNLATYVNKGEYPFTDDRMH